MNDHPNKEIRADVDYALEHGWSLQEAGPRAHIWECYIVIITTEMGVGERSIAHLEAPKITPRIFVAL